MDSLVLASKSPRRREILAALHIPHVVIGVDVSEEMKTARYLKSAVIDVAKRKVKAAERDFSRGLLVGVDTIVVFNGKVLGKPCNEEEAYRSIRMLSGNRHFVLSGITVKDVHSGVGYSSCSKTDVYFTRMSSREIERYVDGGEWADKAGGYAIQGRAALFVERIEGSYYNVMGMPVEELYRILKKFAYFESKGIYRPIRIL